MASDSGSEESISEETNVLAVGSWGSLFQGESSSTQSSTPASSTPDVTTSRQLLALDLAQSPTRLFNSPTTSASTMSKEVDIGGGLKIEVNDTAKAVVADRETPLFRKEERAKLTEEKRNELFLQATRKTLEPKFDLAPLALSKEDMLDDTYDIGMMIGEVRSHFITHDMHDVFTVVLLDEADKDKKTVTGHCDLFEHHITLAPNK